MMTGAERAIKTWADAPTTDPHPLPTLAHLNAPHHDDHRDNRDRI